MSDTSASVVSMVDDNDSIFIWEDSTYKLDRGKPIIYIYGRNYHDPTITREFKVKGFKPYFYVPDDTAVILPSVTFRGEVRQDALGRKVRKVYTGMPSDVSRLRELYEWTDEADILFDKRFVIDKKINYSFRVLESDELTPVTVETPLIPRVCFFDIEVRAPYGIVPLPDFANYPIVTIQCMDSYTKKITIFTIDMPKIADDQVACKDERELLKSFSTYVSHMDFDSLSGWWSNAYDLPYIIHRAKNLNQGITSLSRLGVQPTCKPIEGSREYFIKITGRQCLDMLAAYKKISAGKSELDDYGLKTVSKSYGFAYTDYGANIDELYNSGKYETLLEYCRNDVRALDIIDTKEGMFEFFEGMRHVAGIKLEETLMNSRVIESLIMRNGIKPMPTKRHVTTGIEKFEGALVVDPIIGLHSNVGTFDATALYPTIMLGLNISPDIDGIVVKTLSIAVDEREKLRKYRNETGDNSKKSKENIWKFIANSFYGVIGWDKFRLYNVEQAALVTKTGRDLNVFLQTCAVDKGKTVVAGDSIIGSTKVSINGKLIPIEQLFTNVSYSCPNGKEYCKLTDTYADTIDSNGNHRISNVPYVMRHKTNKKLYKISFNNTQSLTVTEDHCIFGLLNKSIICVEPIELGKTVKSLIYQKHQLSTSLISSNYPIELVKLLGYYVGNGCIDYKKEKPIGIIIATGNDTDEILKKIINPLINLGFIDRVAIKNNKGDIRIYGKITSLIYNLFGQSKHVIPDFIWEDTCENKAAFISGFFSADGTVLSRNNKPIIRATQINQEFLINLQNLLLHVGISSTVFRDNTPNSYKGKTSGTINYILYIKDTSDFTSNVQFIQERKNKKTLNCTITNRNYSLVTIKSIEMIDNYNDYVYDIEVKDTHRFFANFILVHNTDSVLVKPINSADEGLQLQQFMNDQLRDIFTPSINSTHIFTVKFEKLYSRIFFKTTANSKKAAKKRYAGQVVWDEGVTCNKLSFSGNELKRSDQAILSKRIVKSFLDTLLMEGDVDKAVNLVRKAYQDVSSGSISVHDISIPRDIKASNHNDPWSRGLKVLNEEYHETIPAGVKPRVLYLLHDKTVVIHPELNLSGLQIDYKLTANKVIEKKMKSYIESLGYTWNNIVHGQKNLFDF